jgi:hypothetical protein
MLRSGRASLLKALLCFGALLSSAALLHADGTAAPNTASTWPSCSAPTYWPEELRTRLPVNVCGPSRVIPSVNYSYTVVLRNNSKATYRSVKLSVIHYDPITRSSRPFRREARPRFSPMYAAVWTLRNFKPAQTFRLGIRLPFLKHKDPRGSNFMVESRARGAGVFGSTKDVVFIRRYS